MERFHSQHVVNGVPVRIIKTLPLVEIAPLKAAETYPEITIGLSPYFLKGIRSGYQF